MSWIEYEGTLCWRRWERATNKREMCVGYSQDVVSKKEYRFL